ncbi:hypothetical protein HK102_009085 [Quaeritorhiza haematococci]|nr:hypothetical protein HK102_009085 [Quaeritorhiza haematococci]
MYRVFQTTTSAVNKLKEGAFGQSTKVATENDQKDDVTETAPPSTDSPSASGSSPAVASGSSTRNSSLSVVDSILSQTTTVSNYFFPFGVSAALPFRNGSANTHSPRGGKPTTKWKPRQASLSNLVVLDTAPLVSKFLNCLPYREIKRLQRVCTQWRDAGDEILRKRTMLATVELSKRGSKSDGDGGGGNKASEAETASCSEFESVTVELYLDFTYHLESNLQVLVYRPLPEHLQRVGRRGGLLKTIEGRFPFPIADRGIRTLSLHFPHHDVTRTYSISREHDWGFTPTITDYQYTLNEHNQLHSEDTVYGDEFVMRISKDGTRMLSVAINYAVSAKESEETSTTPIQQNTSPSHPPSDSTSSPSQSSPAFTASSPSTGYHLPPSYTSIYSPARLLTLRNLFKQANIPIAILQQLRVHPIIRQLLFCPSWHVPLAYRPLFEYLQQSHIVEVILAFQELAMDSPQQQHQQALPPPFKKTGEGREIVLQLASQLERIHHRVEIASRISTAVAVPSTSVPSLQPESDIGVGPTPTSIETAATSIAIASSWVTKIVGTTIDAAASLATTNTKRLISSSTISDPSTTDGSQSSTSSVSSTTSANATPSSNAMTKAKKRKMLLSYFREATRAFFQMQGAEIYMRVTGYADGLFEDESMYIHLSDCIFPALGVGVQPHHHHGSSTPVLPAYDWCIELANIRRTMD